MKFHMKWVDGVAGTWSRRRPGGWREGRLGSHFRGQDALGTAGETLVATKSRFAGLRLLRDSCRLPSGIGLPHFSLSETAGDDFRISPLRG